MVTTDATPATPDTAGLGNETLALPNRRRRRQHGPDRPPWMEQPNPFMTALKAIVLILIVIIMLFPMINVFATSFSSYRDVLSGDFILFPRHPTLEAYQAIFKGGIVVRALQVSAGLTIFGTFFQMLFTTTLAFGLSRRGVPGTRFVLLLIFGSMLFPPGMIPMYLLVKELGMINTFPSLVAPGLISAFNLIIVRQFFMNIPQELIDSARIDGANEWHLFWNIVMPLSKAVLAVVALFYAVGIWNAWFNAVLYINDTTKWPIQLVLRQYVLQGSALTNASALTSNQPPPPAATTQMAIVVVATVPILIVYPFLQKYFTKGVLTGAIKG